MKLHDNDGRQSAHDPYVFARHLPSDSQLRKIADGIVILRPAKFLKALPATPNAHHKKGHAAEYEDVTRKYDL